MITAYFIARFALGLNILLHGIIRLLEGPTAFVTSIEREFRGTILPAAGVVFFARLLPFAETLIGVLLVIGLGTQLAIVSGFALLMLLLIGKSIKQDWMTVGLQMIYVGFYAVLEALLGYNRISIDFFWHCV
jgi:thiosulfate dehydrogenase [quinone] large subunit